ncbi:GNAT family N-acetyltransferase [Streptomyces sp. NPDC004111]|uniref:GNAT family N-acetyltransferase n=1 Tax=Streptomyces sp. NPDC004111 TaxID=3364690 RepID=UPI00369B56BC
MSGHDIRELHTMAEFEEVSRLFCAVWGTDPASPVVPAEIMRALSHAGNYAAGAYEEGRLTGASLGFFAEPAGTTLHSHITGTTGAGRGTGLALKLHQRQWALDRGLKRITWTYDPLIRRNAHFNLTKLGARPEEYLQSFYGAMDDAINGGDESDRVLAVWDLGLPVGPRPAPHTGQPHTAHAGNPAALPADVAHAVRDHDGHPRLGPMDAEFVLVELPDDIEALRRTDASAARDWRLAVRQTLGELLGEGARVVAMHDRRGYLVRRPATPAASGPNPTPVNAHHPGSHL